MVKLLTRKMKYQTLFVKFELPPIGNVPGFTFDKKEAGTLACDQIKIYIIPFPINIQFFGSHIQREARRNPMLVQISPRRGSGPPMESIPVN